MSGDDGAWIEKVDAALKAADAADERGRMEADPTDFTTGSKEALRGAHATRECAKPEKSCPWQPGPCRKDACAVYVRADAKGTTVEGCAFAVMATRGL